MNVEGPKPKVLSESADVSFKMADGSERACTGSVVEADMEAEPRKRPLKHGDDCGAQTRGRSIEGILLGQNCLLHHGFSIKNIPNLLPSSPRYLPRVRLPRVDSPVPFLQERDIERMKETGKVEVYASEVPCC